MAEPQAESSAAGAKRGRTVVSPERAESAIPAAERNDPAARKRIRRAAEEQIQEEEKRIQEKEGEISQLQKEISEIQKDRELFAKLKRLQTLSEEKTKTLHALRNELWSLRDGAARTLSTTVRSQAGAKSPASSAVSGPAAVAVTPAPATVQAESGKRGEWGERYARKVLKEYICENPLVHTTLNYFESFLTEEMIIELAKVLKADVPTRSNIGRLREMWVGPLCDYFAQREEYNQERSTRRSFSWNTYFHQGYLLKQRGGKFDTNMPIAEYKRRSSEPLFGYERRHPDGSNVDPLALSRLYLVFLRTDHAVKFPCDSHRLGVLGENDPCNGCGLRGCDFRKLRSLN